MTSELSPHIFYPEAKLLFHPTRTSDTDIHPLRGLNHFGPYSSGFVPDPIRVATISPANESGNLFKFLKDLKSTFQPRERKDYLLPWPGFSQVFKVSVCGAPSNCHISLDSSLEDEILSSPSPHIVLSERLIRAIYQLQAARSEFDVIFVYLPIRWHTAFEELKEGFDLHDHLKAITAALGTPIQLIRDDKAVSYNCRASVMWRIGLALYAKAGGVPWKLAETDEESAYIGISYALRNTNEGQPRFITCCSQIFDAEGAGLEFIAYDARKDEIEMRRDNPFLSRGEMFRVMTRSLDLYRRRHAGRAPRRITVHKSTEFKPDEIEGCMEAFHLCESVDLVQIVEDVGWRGAKIDAPHAGGSKGQAAGYPIDRGTLIGLSPRECLLWMHGNAKEINQSGFYFQGGRSTPRPIRLIRHAGHGPWDDTARSALALSKMNWNNDALYDLLPVTMSYAQVLARIIKRMPTLAPTPYQFRFFM